MLYCKFLDNKDNSTPKPSLLISDRTHTTQVVGKKEDSVRGVRGSMSGHSPYQRDKYSLQAFFKKSHYTLSNVQF